MRIVEQRVYAGPNLYANFKVIRMTLDLGPLEERPSATIPGFVEGLLAHVPSLGEHGCSYGEAGGFVRRLREDGGTWLGHVMEHVAIELQNLAGAKVTFGKTRGNGTRGQYHMVYEYEDAWVGERAGQIALRLLHSLIPAELRGDAPPDLEFFFAVEVERLIRGAEKRAFGPSTASLVRGAEARDIPWVRLSEGSLVQFGHGHRQKRIQATVTSETRHIAVEIAGDKELTNRILGDIGLPVPKQEQCYDAEEAIEAAGSLGYPVVVKPLDANHGRGVSIGLTDAEQVRAAFVGAAEHSDCVLVETYIQGFDHRMLVINGELVAVAKRVPGHVIGDGQNSVAELVDRVNRDPRRGIGHEKMLTRLELDPQAERLLQKAGLTAASVLPAGDILYLRSTANLSTGGTAIDQTDVCHPDNREMAVRAAAAVGLDVCGVDFLTPDIARSWKEVGGGICEVNAAPGFRMHVAPSEGKARDVAGNVLDMLFPAGAPSRIPIAAVTGTNGKTTTTRMLAHIHKQVGAHVGMTTTDGVYIDGRLTVAGDMTGPIAARMVLTDPHVTVAVLETARGGLLRAGLGYRHPDVACCLNVSADHLGLGGIHTLEQLAEVKRIPIEVARDTVVLNADDPLCLRMADRTVAKRICWVTLRPDNALVREHVRAGGRAMALEAGINGQMITLYDNGAHLPLLWTHLIPATLEGKALHNVQNAMFAAAMAWSMGVKLDDIRHGLRTFDTTFFQAPGRSNVYDQLGFKVILDYGHNPAAVDAMCSLVDRVGEDGGLRPGAARICVLSAPGDRRDDDIRAIARRAAQSFDRFVCRRDDDVRGRGDDEVPRMLAAELLAAGVAADRVEILADEVAAVDRGLQLARPGDVLLVFGDAISRTWKQIIYFGGRKPTETATAPSGFGGVGYTGGSYTTGPDVDPAPAAAAKARDAHPTAADERAEHGGVVLEVAAPNPTAAPMFVRDARGVRLAADEGGD
ncbi:MAG: cyanophycin synthetase [Pseudomonadota bacterium]|nr:cyanophycin synthetase [Pseudomonadota bacterium]